MTSAGGQPSSPAAPKGSAGPISRALAARGAYVVVNYSSDDDAAEKTVSDIIGIGGKAVAVKADVADASQVEDMFGRIRKDPGRLDILVNNAGIIRDKLLMFMGPDDWDRVIAVNLTGVFNTSKSASRLMIGQKYGKIINIVSPSAIVGRAGQTNYAAAKGGVISFTKSLARELARFSIWVNAVSSRDHSDRDAGGHYRPDEGVVSLGGPDGAFRQLLRRSRAPSSFWRRNDQRI